MIKEFNDREITAKLESPQTPVYKYHNRFDRHNTKFNLDTFQLIFKNHHRTIALLST